MLVLDFALALVLFVAGFVFMEGFAWFAHRFIMHGFLWVLHKDHHVPHKGKLEKNDLFVVLFATPAALMLILGIHAASLVLIALGAGITAYGISYMLFHDIMFHRRSKHLKIPAFSPYFKRIVNAHRHHHSTTDQRKAASFGFLWAPKRFDNPVKK